MDEKKAFDKTRHPIIIKTLRKLGIEGNFLNLKTGIVKTLQVTSLSDERLKLFPKGYPLSLLTCNIVQDVLGFPGGDSGKEPTCQCRRHKRHGFDPWVGKIPWRRAWQPTPVFLPEESNGQRSLVGYGL